jgi:transketolase
VEAKAAVKAAFAMQGPVYLRFGRLAVPVVNDEANYTFEIGKGITLREGKDVTIIANGLLVCEALKAAEELAAEGIDARVINIHTIKPLDTELVVKAARETGLIVTAEEHSIIGGLGEAVCAAVAEECPVPVKRVGVNDEFGHSGPAAKLLEQFGLCASNIAAVTREAYKKHKA